MEGFLGDDVHRGGGARARKLRSGARVQPGRSSSGSGAASCPGCLAVVRFLVDPVWRVRWLRVTAEDGFLNVKFAGRSVPWVLELV